MRRHKANDNNDIWLFTFTHANKLGIPIDVEGWIRELIYNFQDCGLDKTSSRRHEIC